MIALMRENMAADAAVNHAAKRRKNNQGGSATNAAAAFNLADALARINATEPAWFNLIDISAVDARTKIPAHVLAHGKLSPTSAEVVAIIDKKVKAKAEEQAAKDEKKVVAAAKRQEQAGAGHKIFFSVHDGTVSLESLKME